MLLILLYLRSGFICRSNYCWGAKYSTNMEMLSNSSYTASVHNAPTSHDHQMSILHIEAEKCNASDAFAMEYEIFRTFNVSHCLHLWDGLFCWPPTMANQTAEIECPSYFHNFIPHEHAYRHCTSNGTWWTRADGKLWADYAACKMPEVDECASQWTDSIIDLEKERLYNAMYPYMTILSLVGYSLSLVSLIMAIFVLISVRRLYCPRNTLHINLFIAFTIHALATISSRGSIIADYEGGHAVHHQNDTTNDNGVGCRWQTTFFHYAIMANYFWIFIEGLYLNNVISFSVFTDHSRMIWFHIVGGWIPPVLFVGFWAAMRIHFDNCFCWKLNKTTGIFWILRGPITATIIMNFIFFINITRLIFIKFRTQTTLREQQTSSASGRLKYRKLAKSTLVLLAVYGIHFFVLLVIEEINMNIYLDMVLLLIDLAFTSFQGFIASLLLCFANADVRSEVFRMRMFLSNSALGRSGSRISNRLRRISEMERTSESIKMQTSTKARNGPYTNSTGYAPMTKSQTLAVPTATLQPASCESLYLQTADNSDEEGAAK